MSKQKINISKNFTFENSFKNLLFADGTPFGVKVEE